MARLVEAFAGTAAVALRALGCAQPVTAYMGSKRRHAERIVEVLGFADETPDQVVLNDAGPYGCVWHTLLQPDCAHGVVRTLESWESEAKESYQALWDRLAASPEPVDPIDWTATYLWLQSRSANSLPVWWGVDGAADAVDTTPEPGRLVDGRRLRMGDKFRRGRKQTKNAVQRGEWQSIKQKGRGRGGCGGLTSPVTLARRLEEVVDALAGRPAEAMGTQRARGLTSPLTLARRITELPFIGRTVASHTDARQLRFVVGDRAYLDPPYRGSPSYAAECPRNDLVTLGLRAMDEGAERVVISEAEPVEALVKLGWNVTEITLDERKRKPEFLTWASR